ncbi:MAG: transporter [Caulobacteraceae bacterium]|nr:transporter [Caulobacteraceae bacterium]
MLLAACAGPRPQAPPGAAVTPPQAWRNGLAGSSVEVSADWWRAFNDPVLTQIVQTALIHNTDVAIAATRVAEARGQFHLARAQGLPDIQGALQGLHERDVNPGFGVGENQTVGAADVSISYDLDLFGRLANAREAARAELLASQAARDNIRLAVAASAASGYMTLRALDARLAVVQATLADRADALKIARRRTAAGYASQLDLAQAEADYAATARLVPTAQLAIALQEDGLSLLLGESPRAFERGADLAAIALPTIPASVPSSLLRRRPDIAAVEQQLIAANHSLDSARAAFMPDVQLSASGGLDNSTIIPQAVWVYALGGAVLTPIFDSGRLRAQQETVAARRDQAAFAYRKAALVAFREVEDALASLQRLQEQEADLNAERAVLAHTVTLATNRYRAGYSPYLDQLDAQRGLLSADLSLVESRAERLNAAVTLFQALGGGWQGGGYSSSMAAVGPK